MVWEIHVIVLDWNSCHRLIVRLRQRHARVPPRSRTLGILIRLEPALGVVPHFFTWAEEHRNGGITLAWTSTCVAEEIDLQREHS